MIRTLLIGWLVFMPPALAAQSCRQALAIGLDVSGSVDAREYRLQIGGLAQALDSTAVRAALLAQPEIPVALLVYEWSGPSDQRTLAPWSPITDASALDALIATLKAVQRRADATPGTALGMAMTLGVRHLETGPDCWKKTLDISGDGKSNLGPRPRTVKPGLAAKGITINALVIGADDMQGGDTRQSDIGDLAAYFRAEVITGPDAFVETALGFDAYGEAMQTKLLRELDGLVLSRR